MNSYINEPLVQQLPHFYNFMGGWSYVRGVQQLNKLMIATPRHWRGTKIAVTRRGSWYPEDVQTTVYENDVMIYCNHANQEIEVTSFNAGMDTEYDRPLAVCQKCGDGWDEDGAQVMDGPVLMLKDIKKELK